MPLKAVVFDWAGTVIDFGSRAPMRVFVEAFGHFGVPLTAAEARGPMGKPKRDHIAELMALPRIVSAWAKAHGQTPTKADIDRVYEIFVPLNIKAVADFAELVPGAAKIVEALRARGLKIGSTTGYTREVMAPILPLAAAQGYAPDNLVCADDLAEGRPSPLMMYRCFADLGVYPPGAVVKVDDTVPGIEEGLAAGTWTVGIAASGNETGLSLAEWTVLTPKERERVLTPAREKLEAAGAHVVIDTVANLMPVIESIDRLMAEGEVP
ncbi:phosphonoacetaldehyde hydrolase [Phreatobacter stygius]|uniref:Phosphonoacetaldehyde hydrolase n=1 Tax=Phreatobacter stygius TaxID=1940610 RepID=A0A4D7B178_9HYPH|nr:phosphonoacetaldehyde hydrolase [Phreatobacter stygius]QCI63790.1 phosphonoacetaldehyde hydrolase [Phreatobacter stygius]